MENILYPYGYNTYLKPIDAYTTFNFNLVFLTKDCSLRMYKDEENKETYFYLTNINWIKFEELCANFMID